MTPVTRTVWVEPDRLPRWLDDFGARHGGLSSGQAPGQPADPAAVTLHGVDGCRATLGWWADLASATTPASAHDAPASVGLVLVRRGGYAVGRMTGGELVERKIGRRWVQGRTAAGGWSQQRYQRRRENQADALVGAVAGHAVTLTRGVRGLIVGGDRRLVGDVLADPRLRALTPLPRRALWDLPDPDAQVLAEAARRAGQVRIHLAQTH